jgi:hypothetical protein
MKFGLDIVLSDVLLTIDNDAKQSNSVNTLRAAYQVSFLSWNYENILFRKGTIDSFSFYSAVSNSSINYFTSGVWNL